LRIGVDLGGTKIEAVALAADGAEIERRRRPTPVGDYEATVQTVAALVRELEDDLGEPGSVGVGTPGSLAPGDGRIRNANSVCLNGRHLDHDLAAALNRQIRLANDADCFALSEATDGAGDGARTVFGVILGTGVGGGVVVDGRLLDGPNRIAGEWGHNPLPWPTPEEQPGAACYCGLHGCIETFLSGPGMAAEFTRLTGRTLDARGIVTAAAAGDDAAEAAMQRYEDRLARALATVINLLDPDVIVLGGGLSQVPRWYRSVPERWQRYVFSGAVRTRLAAPRHGDSSGVRGAAWLWPD
jgi:fructokinase